MHNLNWTEAEAEADAEMRTSSTATRSGLQRIAGEQALHSAVLTSATPYFTTLDPWCRLRLDKGQFISYEILLKSNGGVISIDLP